MNRHTAASGLSLLAAAATALWLSFLPSALAATDLRIWLGYGAAGFLGAGIGLEITRPGPLAATRTLVDLFLWASAAGLALISLPSTGVTSIPHRIGWLALLVASVDYAYVTWWHPATPGKAEALSDLLTPSRQHRADPAQDGVARAMIAAAPAYLFLISVAGTVHGTVLGSRSESLLLFGWLASLALGGALYVWPRMLARSAGSRHLARGGAVLWHLGLVLSVVVGREWLLALTGLGGALLLSDLVPTLRGVRRGRPYVVGSRRRYPQIGARLGLALAALLLLAFSVALMVPKGAGSWQSVLGLAFSLAANLTLLHHLRPAMGAQLLRARGGWMPGLLSLASIGLRTLAQPSAALVALASIYLAVSWLPGLSMRPPQQQQGRSRRPG